MVFLKRNHKIFKQNILIWELGDFKIKLVLPTKSSKSKNSITDVSYLKWYGWRGVILDIHLSKWKVSKRPLDINLAKMYLGGRGLNSRMLYETIDLHIEPLSPENLLIFSTGPLNGTLAPACCRTTVTAKSPLIGILGDGNVGGFLGPEIKYAGYDSIIFRGK